MKWLILLLIVFLVGCSEPQGQLDGQIEDVVVEEPVIEEPPMNITSNETNTTDIPINVEPELEPTMVFKDGTLKPRVLRIPFGDTTRVVFKNAGDVDMNLQILFFENEVREFIGYNRTVIVDMKPTNPGSVDIVVNNLRLGTIVIE